MCSGNVSCKPKWFQWNPDVRQFMMAGNIVWTSGFRGETFDTAAFNKVACEPTAFDTPVLSAHRAGDSSITWTSRCPKKGSLAKTWRNCEVNNVHKVRDEREKFRGKSSKVTDGFKCDQRNDLSGDQSGDQRDMITSWADCEVHDVDCCRTGAHYKLKLIKENNSK